MERQVANFVFFQEEKKFQEETWMQTTYQRKGSKYSEEGKSSNVCMRKKGKWKKQVIHDKLLMKNSPKLQCFNQKLWNINFIYCITNKNKMAELGKKQKQKQPLKENQRPVTQQCFILSIKLMEHLIAASEFRKH